MKTSRAAIFAAYNRLRAFSRAHPDRVDPRRLNRALGLLQRSTPRPYPVSLDACACMDWSCKNTRRRGYRGPCKHILAYYLAAQVERIKP